MGHPLIDKISTVERLSTMSKAGRFLSMPVRYAKAILFRKLIYPRNKKELITTARLFYGPEMTIALPAATDIFLTGGKSHDSEIRLAKFIILNLVPGDHFLDIGGHYGYFTLLAAYLVGEKGKVLTFEPSQNYSLLKKNTDGLSNVTIYQEAVSNTNEGLVFYEFPNLYSEYNSVDISQFENEAWFKESKPKKIEVASTTIDDILKSTPGFLPKLIKIDVEGGEYTVMQGGINFIETHSGIFIMEYLAPDRHNEAHKKALNLLRDNGYYSYQIGPDGQLVSLSDVDKYLTENGLESDNIVFKKP